MVSSERPTTVLPFKRERDRLVGAYRRAVLLVHYFDFSWESISRRRAPDSAPPGPGRRSTRPSSPATAPSAAARPSCFCSISWSALTVPTRHGVHWPQDSSEKNFIRLRAAPVAVSWFERITIAADPMKQPYCVQRVEVERDVGHRRRQDSARRAARKVPVELVTVEHAAAVFVDQFRHA